MSEHLPWRPHYVDDWRQSRTVRAMTWAQRGIFSWLLDEQWADGGLPADTQTVAQIIGAPLGDVGKVLALAFPRSDDGLLRNERLEEIRREQQSPKQRHREGSARGGRRSGEVRRAKARERKRLDAGREGSRTKPEPEPEPDNVTCEKCGGEGKIVDDRGKILRCCDCPAGRERALRFARERELEEDSERRRAEDAKMERGGTGPSRVGDLVRDAVRKARPQEG